MYKILNYNQIWYTASNDNHLELQADILGYAHTDGIYNRKIHLYIINYYNCIW